MASVFLGLTSDFRSALSVDSSVKCSLGSGVYCEDFGARSHGAQHSNATQPDRHETLCIYMGEDVDADVDADADVGSRRN